MADLEGSQLRVVMKSPDVVERAGTCTMTILPKVFDGITPNDQADSYNVRKSISHRVRNLVCGSMSECVIGGLNFNLKTPGT